MSDVQARQLIQVMLSIIGGLLTLVGILGLMMWNGQLDVIKTMNERISRLEVSCKADFQIGGTGLEASR